jgi:hypothetical protein
MHPNNVIRPEHLVQLAKLTKQRLKRGVFVSVVDLQAAINRFVVEHNTKPKPFAWTADPERGTAARRPRFGH